MALGIALRIWPWFRPHTLLGVMEVDDGVYYGAAKMLLHGYVPYSDFTILHPPVTSLLLLPFAGLGALFGDPVGLAAARVAMALVAVANIVLVHRLALRIPTSTGRQRQGALAAALFYAVMPNAVLAEHTVLLEPLVNLACLLAVLCLSKGRGGVVAAGVLIAAAAGIKVFAAAYVFGLLIWMAISHRRALIAPLVAGLALGTTVLIGPFFALAPTAFWREVVVTQLSRPADGSPGGLVRELDTALPHLLSVATALALLTTIVAVCVLRERRVPGSPVTLWMLVAGLGGFAFLNSPSYFAHYSAFLVPPGALVVSRLATRRRPLHAGTILLALLLLGYAASSVRDDLRWGGQRDLAEAGQLVPHGSCVFYEAISLAIAADVLTFPRRDCPSWIDGRGVALTQNTHWPHSRGFYPDGFREDERWQRDTRTQLQHADFLLLYKNPRGTVEWTAQTQTYALTHFTPVWVTTEGQQKSQLWKRTTPVG